MPGGHQRLMHRGMIDAIKRTPTNCHALRATQKPPFSHAPIFKTLCTGIYCRICQSLIGRIQRRIKVSIDEAPCALPFCAGSIPVTGIILALSRF
jgi:hypothetical protein